MNTFRGQGWRLVTDNQALKSIFKAIGVKDDDYRCVYVLAGIDETVVSASGSTSLLEVWADSSMTISTIRFYTNFGRSTGINIGTTKS
jgi:hypothetical protein